MCADSLIAIFFLTFYFDNILFIKGFLNKAQRIFLSIFVVVLYCLGSCLLNAKMHKNYNSNNKNKKLHSNLKKLDDAHFMIYL